VANCDPRLKVAAISKIFGKYGPVLKVFMLERSTDTERSFRVEFEKTADATKAYEGLNGKVALKRKLRVCYETDDTGGVSEESKIRSIEDKLSLLEQGVDANDMIGRIAHSKNSFMFKGDKGAKGHAVWNGLGTTRTKQSPTLFLANIPGSISESKTFQEQMQQIFQEDAGFFAVRIVRKMWYVALPYGTRLRVC
jgi:RNA recognition motif-containing protein